MAQQDMDLLLRDLSARLPYGVKAILSEYHIDEFPYIGTYCDKVINLGISGSTINLLNHIEKYGVRPYLRPMSSMTKEELCEVQEILGKGVEIHDVFISIVDSSINTFSYLELQAIFEWLLKNHFDFMGLIPKGLAIAVTEENNPYEN